jgi:hypothetical protein
MKKFLDLKTILILGLVAVIFFMRACGGKVDEDVEIINVGGKDYELLEHKVDTLYEEKIVEVPTYFPQYIEKLVEVKVEIPADIDSLAVIQKYYSSYKVTDTLHLKYNFAEALTDVDGNKPNSNLGFGIVTDVISQNAIQSRDIIWNYRIPTIYDTKIVKELPKNQLYIGGGVGFDKVNFLNGAKAGLIYKTKSDKMFGVDLGVTNNVLNPTTGQSALTPYVGGSMYWKIKIGRK